MLLSQFLSTRFVYLHYVYRNKQGIFSTTWFSVVIIGGDGRTRTYDPVLNRHSLYLLSYVPNWCCSPTSWPLSFVYPDRVNGVGLKGWIFTGGPYETRTRVTAVTGRHAWPLHQRTRFGYYLCQRNFGILTRFFSYDTIKTKNFILHLKKSVAVWTFILFPISLS